MLGSKFAKARLPKGHARQLRWLGHVRRMPETRLSKELLTAWLPQKRPVGRPELTYGQAVVRTARAVEAAGGLVQPAAAAAAAAATAAAAVATTAAGTAAAPALRATCTEPRGTR
jgi:hypothetical protein